MGSDANRLRRKWQDYSGFNAGKAEKAFYFAFTKVFENTEYVIRDKPNEFSKIYVNIELSDDELSQIYIPDKPITRHGVFS